MPSGDHAADLRLLGFLSATSRTSSVATTVGVLVLGVLPGVLLAVALSLIWLLYVGSRPNDAVLGRVAGRELDDAEGDDGDADQPLGDAGGFCDA